MIGIAIRLNFGVLALLLPVVYGFPSRSELEIVDAKSRVCEQHIDGSWMQDSQDELELIYEINKFKAIAEISCLSNHLAEVGDVLSKNGIICEISGSRAQIIYVPETNRDAAIDLLNEWRDERGADLFIYKIDQNWN